MEPLIYICIGIGILTCLLLVIQYQQEQAYYNRYCLMADLYYLSPSHQHEVTSLELVLYIDGLNDLKSVLRGKKLERVERLVIQAQERLQEIKK